MSRSPLVVAAATIGAATLLVVSALLLFGPEPGSTTSVGPGVPEPGSTSPADPDRSGSADGRVSGRTSPSASSARAGTPGPTSSAGAAGSPPAAEMPSDDAEGGGQPGPEDYSLPPVPESQPASADTRNALVAAPRSVVASSTRSSLEGAVQVAIVASKHASADALLGYYRGRLTRFGFTEFPASAVSGSTAVAFRHGRDRVVVTVTPGARGSVDYSVFGILHSARS